MAYPHRDKLKACISKLIGKTNHVSVLQYMNSITANDRGKIEKIQFEKGVDEAWMQLIDDVDCKRNGYKEFLAALMRTGNEDLVQSIDSDIYSTIQIYKESDNNNHNKRAAHHDNVPVAVIKPVPKVEVYTRKPDDYESDKDPDRENEKPQSQTSKLKPDIYISEIKYKVEVAEKCMTMLEHLETEDVKVKEEIQNILSTWKTTCCNNDKEEMQTKEGEGTLNHIMLDLTPQTMTEEALSGDNTPNISPETTSDTLTDILVDTTAETSNTAQTKLLAKNMEKDLYRDGKISCHIQDVYWDDLENCVCIIVDKGKATTASSYIDNNSKYKQYQRLKCKFEEEGDNCFSYLAGKVKMDPLIGPGSWLVIKDKTFVEKLNDGTLTGMDLSQLLCANEDTTKFGTLGCFAENLKDECLYALTTKHTLETEMEVVKDGHIFVISGIDFNAKVSLLENNFHKEQLEVKEPVCLSERYKGILREECDIALLGPLSKDLLSTHETFCKDERYVLKVKNIPSEDLVDSKVKKLGAKTGFTYGRIAQNQQNKNMFLVVSNDDGDDFADTGDSGALVLLDDGQWPPSGLGIISKRSTNMYLKGKLYKSVAQCLKLHTCIGTLEEEFNCKLKLYYTRFFPKLYLKRNERIEVYTKTSESTSKSEAKTDSLPKKHTYTDQDEIKGAQAMSTCT